MASINYDAIFEDFLGNIRDYDLIRVDDATVSVFMIEWLHKSLARPYIRRLFSSLSLDDDARVLEFELKTSVDNESDLDFVRYILAKSMVVEWMEPNVKKSTLINQMFANDKQKFYSQSAHLSEVRGLLEDVKNEVRSIIRDRGWIYNPYLED